MEGIDRYSPLVSLNQARELARRYREVDEFHSYVSRRLPLVLAVSILIVLISVACAAASVVFVSGSSAFVAFLGLIVAPFVLVGSLLVQMFVFFSWLESRSLMRLVRALGRRAKRPRTPLGVWFEKKTGAYMGEFPPVPWVLAAIFVIAPLLMLASISLKIAALVIAAAIVVPVGYALLDR